jgi:hypothetical protein
MARQNGYTLVSKTIPSRRRTGFYELIIADFKASKDKSVLVDGTERKPATLVQGLRKVLKAEGATNVKVVQRGDETYLVKG